jgi:homoserine O-acetyltransferase
MVRVQAALTNHLGIDAWASVIGGSMGGMQALEWAVMYPKRVRSIIPIASCMAASPQQIAWGALGRQAIMQDPAWRGGDYHDAGPGEGPHRGLALARQIAQVTFRSDEVFEERFGRQTLDGEEAFGQHDRYQVESYLDHHGDKLVRRFDAGSYVTLAKAMDLHDLARGRGGIAPALRRVQVPVLTLGITSDLLYPIRQQREMAAALRSVGVPVEHVELESPHGHDAFLIEEERVGEALVKFLSEVRERDGF